MDGAPSIKQHRISSAWEDLLHVQHSHSVIPYITSPERPVQTPWGPPIGRLYCQSGRTSHTYSSENVTPHVCIQSKHMNTYSLADYIMCERCVSPAAQVTTSDIKGAGTDAGIEINLLGATGETGYHPLMANYDTFERGQVCVAKKTQSGSQAQMFSRWKFV